MTAATVAIPTARAGDSLRRALEALARQTVPIEVIVADNGSRTAAADAEAIADLHVEVLRFEENVGFVRAVNEAARRASGDALVVLNDDCVCDPTFVERLVSRLAPGRGVVMAAGVLRDVRDPGLIDTAGIAVDASLLVFDYLNGEPLERLHGAAVPIGPCGAAAAYDREAFLEAGGFDDALFAYWEDIDLALRLRLAGGTCALAPDAQGIHQHSATLGSGSTAKNYLVGFGRGYTLRKWSVLAHARPALQAVIGDAAICAGQGIVDRNVSGLRGRVDGYRAARASTRHPYPAGLLPAPSRPLSGSLRPRVRRRLRLRATA